MKEKERVGLTLHDVLGTARLAAFIIAALSTTNCLVAVCRLASGYCQGIAETHLVDWISASFGIILLLLSLALCQSIDNVADWARDNRVE